MKDASQGKPQDDELVRARELLARTLRFLAQCAEDPEAAVKAEDPRELIRALEGLAISPDAPADMRAEPRTIQIRHRRSA